MCRSAAIHGRSGAARRPAPGGGAASTIVYRDESRAATTLNWLSSFGIGAPPLGAELVPQQLVLRQPARPPPPRARAPLAHSEGRGHGRLQLPVLPGGAAAIPSGEGTKIDASFRSAARASPSRAVLTCTRVDEAWHGNDRAPRTSGFISSRSASQPGSSSRSMRMTATGRDLIGRAPLEHDPVCAFASRMEDPPCPRRVRSFLVVAGEALGRLAGDDGWGTRR